MGFHAVSLDGKAHVLNRGTDGGFIGGFGGDEFGALILGGGSYALRCDNGLD